MLTVPVEIKKSEIHGYGVFAVSDIHEGTVVWMYDRLDQRYSAFALEHAEKRIQNYVMQRGYINRRAEFVLCIDEAQFLNFPRPGETANLRLGGLQDDEYLLIANVDIPVGTELTVPLESDADAARKLSLR